MNSTQAPPQTGQPVYVITPADRERQKRIAKAWTAYEGELDKPFQKMDDEPDLNVMGNEVQPAVDAVVNFVFGDEVEISVDVSNDTETSDDPADQPEPPDYVKVAQKLLDKVWGRKERRIPLLQRWILNGDASGRAFLRIVPGPDVKAPKQRTFRLIEVDPATIFVKTAPQDCETVLLFCIQYSCDELNATGKTQTVFYREEISRIDPDQDGDDGDTMADTDATWSIQHWTQTTQGQQPTNNAWVPAGEPIPWPYPFPPIFSNQNLPKPNEFWGYPGVTKSLIGINESLNFINGNINITSKLQRLLYAPGMGDGTVDVTPNRITSLPLPENEIKAVNLQSDVANTRAFAGDLHGEAEALSGVPMIASGRTANMPSGNIPGITMRLMFQSLLKKMGKMRCLYGETMIEISQAVLVLAGFVDEIEITLGWQDPLPSDDLHEIQAAIALGELGVSKTTRLRALGYDPKEEAKLCAMEAAQAMANNPLLPVAPEGTPPLPGQPKPMPVAQEGQQSGNDQQQSEQAPVAQKG
jgi:hypothetical protein